LVCSDWASKQQIVDQTADPRDLRLHQALDPGDLLARGLRLGREDFELPADHGQRCAELVRGVGDELALPCERVGEPDSS
jgi:hypothetical protein